MKDNNGWFDLVDDAELRFRIDTLGIHVKVAFQRGVPVKIARILRFHRESLTGLIRWGSI